MAGGLDDVGMRGIGDAERGGRRHAADEPASWRWLAALLALVLHAGLYPLLRSTGEAVAPARKHEAQRVRLAWVARAPAVPVPRADRSDPKAGAHPPRRIAGAGARAPAHGQEAAPVLHVEGGDTWSPAPNVAAGAVPGTDFARDPFRRPGGPDPFAPVERLPNLRMRDASFGGWLQEQARLRACGELKAALSRQAESTHAILASMRRWNCTI